jgi:hypothetical protein
MRGPCLIGSHEEVHGEECGAWVAFCDQAARCRSKRERGSTWHQCVAARGGALGRTEERGVRAAGTGAVIVEAGGGQKQGS